MLLCIYKDKPEQWYFISLMEWYQHVKLGFKKNRRFSESEPWGAGDPLLWFFKASLWNPFLWCDIGRGQNTYRGYYKDNNSEPMDSRRPFCRKIKWDIGWRNPQAYRVLLSRWPEWAVDHWIIAWRMYYYLASDKIPVRQSEDMPAKRDLPSRCAKGHKYWCQVSGKQIWYATCSRPRKVSYALLVSSKTMEFLSPSV